MKTAAALLLVLASLAACSPEAFWTQPVAGQPGCYKNWQGTACYHTVQP